jgi:hypothetical protein
VARLLGVSQATVAEWRHQGLPYVEAGGPGHPHRYDPAACQRWYDIRRSSPRAKLAMRAEIQKLQLRATAARGGTLVDRDLALTEIKRVCHNCQKRLFGMAGRLAPQMLGIDSVVKAREMIDQEIAAAMTLLHEFKLPTPRHRGA